MECRFKQDESFKRCLNFFAKRIFNISQRLWFSKRGSIKKFRNYYLNLFKENLLILSCLVIFFTNFKQVVRCYKEGDYWCRDHQMIKLSTLMYIKGFKVRYYVI